MRRGFFGRGLALMAVAAAMLPRTFARGLERMERKRQGGDATERAVVRPDRRRGSLHRYRPPAGSAAAEALLLRAAKKRERRKGRNGRHVLLGGYGKRARQAARFEYMGW